jgi:hypothetical protein
MAERERRTQELLKSCEVRCGYVQGSVTAEYNSVSQEHARQAPLKQPSNQLHASLVNVCCSCSM